MPCSNLAHLRLHKVGAHLTLREDQGGSIPLLAVRPSPVLSGFHAFGTESSCPRSGYGSGFSSRLLERFENEFWDDDFPAFGAEAVLVSGIRAFAVPGGNG